MDKLNKQELRRLAEEATPGEWGYDGSYVCTSRNEDGTVYVESWNPVSDCLLTKNAKYIAAANPAAILSLLDELERLEANHNQLNHGVAVAATSEWNRLAEENDQLRAELEQYRKDAERYEFVRALENDCWMLNALQCVSGKELDEAIDAELAKEGGANG